VRQRVARHLLDLASARVREQPASDHLGGRELTVQVSQQELADAVGTVREVVVRVLRELRRDGVVRTERDRIVLLEPARLIQEQGVEPRFLTSPARASTLRPMTRGRPRDTVIDCAVVGAGPARAGASSVGTPCG
jgi:biotin operon repressor